MRTLFIGTFLVFALGAGLGVAWWAMNYYAPGKIGTPAHAGVVSQGRPEQCTNVALTVRARSAVEHRVVLQTGSLVRGTFEVNGGIGRVDVFLRVRSPQNEDILASPRTDNYDFTFPARSHGEYVFLFDNRFSIFTSKAVGLFFCVEVPGTLPPNRDGSALP